MKKIIFLFAFIAMGLSMNAQKMAIKTGPILLGFGSANAAFEYQFADKMSVLLKGSYLYGLKVGDERITGYTLGAGFRYYFKQNKSLAGFYMQPQAKYFSANYYRATLLLGYQWRWDGGLVLDVAIGPSKYFGSGAGSLPVILPATTLAVGYAF